MRFNDFRSCFVRVINNRFDIFARALFFHNAVNRHIEPRGQTRDVIGIRFSRTVFDARKRRSRNIRLISHIPQTQTQFFTTAFDCPSEFDCINQTFIFITHNSFSTFQEFKCYRCTHHFTDKT